MREEIRRLTDADLDAVAGGFTGHRSEIEVMTVDTPPPPPPPTMGSVWNSFCDAAGATGAKIT
jgi:hypothetical protein